MDYGVTTVAVAVMAGGNLGAVGVAAARWLHSRQCTPEQPCAACRESGRYELRQALHADREVPIAHTSEAQTTSAGR